MHHQTPGPIRRQIARPLNDELLRARVKVALTERRRIDRVEELSQFCNTNLNNRTTLRESVSSGPRPMRHLSSKERERMIRRVDNSRDLVRTRRSTGPIPDI